MLRHDRAALELRSKKRWSLSTHKSSAVICFLFVYVYMCVYANACAIEQKGVEVHGKYSMLSKTFKPLYTRTDENMDSGCSTKCEIHPAENIITEEASNTRHFNPRNFA